jgi:hypothetical protein
VLRVLSDTPVRLVSSLSIDGTPAKGAWDGDEIRICVPAHQSFDDLVLTLLHEAVHGAYPEMPESLTNEALDRIAFSSPRLRWAAACILGDLLMGRKLWRD